MNQTSKLTIAGSHIIVTALLALLLIFGLLAAIPLVASAANQDVYIAQDDTIAQIQNKIQTAIDASSSGGTVTVIGDDIDNVLYPLQLDIKTGVTVIWKTGFICPSNIYRLIDIWGDGVFEVAEGGWLEIGTTGAVIYAEIGNTVIINGGMVKSGLGTAIHANNVVVKAGTVIGDSHAIWSQEGVVNITVSGGTVKATRYDGYAIRMECNDIPAASSGTTGGVINISGGSIDGEGTYATGIAARNCAVTISGGTVTAGATAISISGTNPKVAVSGGAISSDGYCISAYYGLIGYMPNGELSPPTTENPEVTVSGGTIRSINSPAINLSGGIVTASGGIISSAASNEILGAIYTKDAYISGTAIVRAEGASCAIWCNYANINGGTIEAADETYAAIEAAYIDMSGGVVSARSGYAIDQINSNASFNITGGFVFAYGTTIIGVDNIINYAGSGAPEIGGNAVVCAWNNPGGVATYDEGTSVDLIVEPSAATAKWSIVGTQSGISYKNGANEGFHPIGDATVNVSGAANSSNNAQATATATAAVGSIGNFERTRQYTPGMFADVNEDLWYGYNRDGAIANAYEYELMTGDSATIFNPEGNITIAEAITIATRIYSLYTSGSPFEYAPEPGSEWYQRYVEYAITNGIISATDFNDYGRAATRAEMAYIFSRSLPAQEFVAQNTVNSLPDVNDGTPYSDALLMLYGAGVVVGDAGTGAFRPGDSIIRAEAAAIVSRVILPDTRASGNTYG